MMLGELHLQSHAVLRAVCVQASCKAMMLGVSLQARVRGGVGAGIAAWGSGLGVGVRLRAQGQGQGQGSVGVRAGRRGGGGAAAAAYLCSVRNSMRICLRSCSAQPSATTLSAYRLRGVVRCRTSLTKPELPSPSIRTSSRDLSHSTPPSPLGPPSEEEAAAGVPPGWNGRVVRWVYGRVCVHAQQRGLAPSPAIRIPAIETEMPSPRNEPVSETVISERLLSETGAAVLTERLGMRVFLGIAATAWCLTLAAHDLQACRQAPDWGATFL